MSKIFRIHGNFIKNGEWSTPDPAFTGEIVLYDETNFYGYCDELYAEADDPKHPNNKERFLTGMLIPNNDSTTSMIFFKLSNDPEQNPLAYYIPNIKKYNVGYWAAGYLQSASEGSTLFSFRVQGSAKVYLTEQPYSEKDDARIYKRFDKLNRESKNNSFLPKDGDSCNLILLNMQQSL